MNTPAFNRINEAINASKISKKAKEEAKVLIEGVKKLAISAPVEKDPKDPKDPKKSSKVSKSKKEPKEPGQRKPLNDYMIFCKYYRKAHSDQTFKAADLGDLWKNSEPAAKQELIDTYVEPHRHIENPPKVVADDEEEPKKATKTTKAKKDSKKSKKQQDSDENSDEDPFENVVYDSDDDDGNN